MQQFGGNYVKEDNVVATLPNSSRVDAHQLQRLYDYQSIDDARNLQE